MILFKAQAPSPPSCHITDKDFVTDDVITKYSTVQKKEISFATLGLSPWEGVLYSPASLEKGKADPPVQEAASLGPPRLIQMVRARAEWCPS